MSTTLEKATQALLSEVNNQGGHYFMLAPHVEKVVRAVLLAIREPDEEQVRAGWMAVPGYDYDRDDIKMAFEIMIDAILAQPSEGEG